MLQPREGNTQEGTSPNLARYSSARNPKNNALTHSLNPLCSQWSIRCQQSSSIQAGIGQATEVHSRSSPCFLHLCFNIIVRLQVPSGLPLPLFPGGAHVSAAYAWRSFFMRSTWPSHFQRCFFTSWTMSLMPACFQTSPLVTLCSQFGFW